LIYFVIDYFEMDNQFFAGDLFFVIKKFMK